MSVVDFHHELESIARTVEPEDAGIPEIVIELSTIALHDVDMRYGPFSRNPMPHHNAEHSLDVAGRVVRLTNLLWDFIPQRYQKDIFALGMHAASGHDYEQSKGPGKNERASAKYVRNTIINRGYQSQLGQKYFQRVGAGIMATEVEFVGDKIIQPNLRKGEADPLRFIVAFADINAIAMEGPNRMIRDATNLYFERSAHPKVDHYLDMLASQVKFLRRRLNDWQIEGDIEYYFSAHQDEVYDVMYREFHDNIVQSSEIAGQIAENEATEDIIGKIIKGADPLGVGSRAVEALSKFIHHN